MRRKFIILEWEIQLCLIAKKIKEHALEENKLLEGSIDDGLQ